MYGESNTAIYMYSLTTFSYHTNNNRGGHIFYDIFSLNNVTSFYSHAKNYFSFIVLS